MGKLNMVSMKNWTITEKFALFIYKVMINGSYDASQKVPFQQPSQPGIWIILLL